MKLSREDFVKLIENKKISDIDFKTVFARYQNQKLDGNYEDNPTISKSALYAQEVGEVKVGFYVMSIRYYYLGRHNLEKCGYVIVIFDPDTSNLCPDCNGSFEVDGTD